MSTTHTRAAILRGGSYYSRRVPSWYFPQAYELHQHGKSADGSR